MSQYPIVATPREIWAVNPENKRRLKLGHERTKILDLYANNRGIYHAAEGVSHNTKLVETWSSGKGRVKVPKEFPFNFVTIYDTLSGNPIRTVYPEGQQDRPVEERMLGIDFSFMREERALKFEIDGISHVLLETVAGDVQPDTSFSYEGDRVYYAGRRIARFNEDIIGFEVVDASEFPRLLRRKNKPLHNKFRRSFQ